MALNIKKSIMIFNHLGWRHNTKLYLAYKLYKFKMDQSLCSPKRKLLFPRWQEAVSSNIINQTVNQALLSCSWKGTGGIHWGQNSKVISEAVRITFRIQLITVSTKKKAFPGQKIAFNSHYISHVLFGSLNEDGSKSDVNLSRIILRDLLLQNMKKKKAYAAEGIKSDFFFPTGNIRSSSCLESLKLTETFGHLCWSDPGKESQRSPRKMWNLLRVTAMKQNSVHRNLPWKEEIWIQTHQTVQAQTIPLKKTLAPIRTKLNKLSLGSSASCNFPLSILHLV